jgi:hypothetical protein
MRATGRTRKKRSARGIIGRASSNQMANGYLSPTKLLSAIPTATALLSLGGFLRAGFSKSAVMPQEEVCDGCR